MARKILITVLVALIALGCSQAAARSFGLGIILGEPTGLSLKKWLGGRQAVDAAAAWSFNEESAVHFHMDYLVHAPSPPEMNVKKLMLYFGLGGRVKLEEDDSRLGARIPLGIDYVFSGGRLDFFLEIVPVLDLAPETEFHMNGGFGMRCFF